MYFITADRTSVLKVTSGGTTTTVAYGFGGGDGNSQAQRWILKGGESLPPDSSAVLSAITDTSDVLYCDSLEDWETLVDGTNSPWETGDTYQKIHCVTHSSPTITSYPDYPTPAGSGTEQVGPKPAGMSVPPTPEHGRIQCGYAVAAHGGLQYLEAFALKPEYGTNLPDGTIRWSAIPGSTVDPPPTPTSSSTAISQFLTYWQGSYQGTARWTTGMEMVIGAVTCYDTLPDPL